jgi:ABC-2 type transport system ATP-binding protein
MIKITNFTKKYGSLVAVDNLSMEIDEGDIFGFIGPNGAGKTTTIKFLSTLLKPDVGDAEINGYSVRDNLYEVRRSIGYMPDYYGVYQGMTVWEYLDFFGAAYHIPLKKRKTITSDVLELLDLTGKRDDFVSSLSRGMRQRLCLAKTLVHDPKVLILDEPASGLDPRARIEIKELLKELKKMGKTIFISSHILSELADLCNKIGIIEKGVLLAHGDIDEIKRKIKQTLSFKVKVANNSEKAHEVILGYPGVIDASREDSSITVDFSGQEDEIPGLITLLVNNEIKIIWTQPIDTNLEEVFLTITKGEVS